MRIYVPEHGFEENIAGCNPAMVFVLRYCCLEDLSYCCSRDVRYCYVGRGSYRCLGDNSVGGEIDRSHNGY